MRPVNDPRSWNSDDDWFVCFCGNGDFWVKRDRETDLPLLLCNKCEADHTMPLFGGEA